jgi:hypothetical protein
MMLNAGAIKYGLVVCAEGSRDGIGHHPTPPGSRLHRRNL